MATRLRKVRKLRGSRTHGWGQIGQHRASGHKGGVGVAGMLKHHYSSMLKYDPEHYGHDSTHPPHPDITKKWANVRDLDDLFLKFGDAKDGKKVIDLSGKSFDKLLGGGKITTAYTVKVRKASSSAVEKVKQAGGEVITENG